MLISMLSTHWNFLRKRFFNKKAIYLEYGYFFIVYNKIVMGFQL